MNATPLDDALLRRLVAALPDLDPAQLRLIGEGYGSIACRVEGESGPRVVRVPKTAWARDDLEREARLLPLIARAPFEVAVPREPLTVRDDGGRLLAVVHRLVPGTLLASQPLRGRATRARFARDLAAFLSTLHTIPIEEARAHGAAEQDLWEDEYVPLIERAMPHLPPATRAWLEQRAEAFDREGASRGAPRVLVHGDISGLNLLTDEHGTLSGVIDFGDARIADPALDFAGVLNDFPWRFLEQVWAHYTGTLDADVRRRTRFYIEVAPLYQVVYGEEALGPEERRAGIRRLAARASAATRERERHAPR